jgi:L-alanine-DL-glutamate epimerase-like enolase superfamily enzyme
LLEPLGVQGVVDPLAAGDFVRHQDLESATSVRLAVSQLIAGPADILALAKVARMPQVVVNLDRLGGLTALRKCVACAEAANVPIAIGGAARMGVATAAVLHLAAAMPHLSTAQELACHVLQDDVTVERLVSTDGSLSVPQSPGLGIEVDRDKVDELAARD